MYAEEHNGYNKEEDGWLELLADVALATEESAVDLEAPQNNEDESEQDPEAPHKIEEGEEMPQDSEEAGEASQGFYEGGGVPQTVDEEGDEKFEGFDDGQVTPWDF